MSFLELEKLIRDACELSEMLDLCEERMQREVKILDAKVILGGGGILPQGIAVSKMALERGLHVLAENSKVVRCDMKEAIDLHLEMIGAEGMGAPTVDIESKLSEKTAQAMSLADACKSIFLAAIEVVAKNGG